MRLTKIRADAGISISQAQQKPTLETIVKEHHRSSRYPSENEEVIEPALNAHSDATFNVSTSPTIAMDNSELDDFRASTKVDTKMAQSRHKGDTDADTKINVKSAQRHHKDDTKSAQIIASKEIEDISTDKMAQSRHKGDTDADTKINVKSAQRHHKDDTKSAQIIASKEIEDISTDKMAQSRHKGDTDADTKLGTKSAQNIKQPVQNFSVTKLFEELAGNELRIALYIFDQLSESSACSIESSYEKISHFSSVNLQSTPTTTKRLVTKGLIQKKVPLGRGKKGVLISSSLEMIVFYTKNKSYLAAKIGKVGTNCDTKSGTNCDTKPSSKIDSIYNNTNYLTGEPDANGTQTPSQHQAQNLGWFKSLNFSAIPYIKPMMVNSAIRTLVETKLDPDDVQMFINKFKNWLVTQNKIQNPLAIFCDKLKEYANEGDSPVLAVMSDEELQVEYLMAQDLEKKRAEMDLINKARTFKQEQDKEALFQEWVSQASDEEKRSLYPETSFAKFGSDIYTIGLKDAFLNLKLG